MTPRGIDAAFPAAEFAVRVAALRAAMAARGLDAALFTGPENIFYLTGQQTPGYYTFQCLILPASGEPHFLLRHLELFNFLRNTLIESYETYDDGIAPADLVIRALSRMGLGGKHVAVEKGGWFLPIQFYETLLDRFGAFEDVSGMVEMLRRIKSPAELAAIEDSARQADAGIAAGLAAVRVGATENDVVAAMMGAAIGAGAEYMGMEPLVAAGPRSGVPHATWRGRRLQPGDPVFLEMAGCARRYHAGLMRTAWLGEPPMLARTLEQVVLAALQAVLDIVRPGATCAQAHGAAQSVIDAAGMTDRFRKRSGYSIGISFAPDWGEWQVLSFNTDIDVPLQPGMCFHVPITLRAFGEFTVGISESIVITQSGYRVLGGLDRPMVVQPHTH